jgi:hypothetical protein
MSSGSIEIPGWVVSAMTAWMVSVKGGFVVSGVDVFAESDRCAFVESFTWALAAVVFSKQ